MAGVFAFSQLAWNLLSKRPQAPDARQSVRGLWAVGMEGTIPEKEEFSS